MRARAGRFFLAGAGLFLFASADVARAKEPEDWKTLVALPPTRGSQGNAFFRWVHATAATPELAADERALAEGSAAAPLDEVARRAAESLCRRWSAALAAFTLASGEFVEFPRALGPEGVVPEIDQLRALAAVARIQLRLLIAHGAKAQTARVSAEMIRIGSAACEGCNSLPSLFAAFAILSSGLDGAEWIANQTAVGAEENASLAAAIRASADACARGFENAVRGEYQLVFRVVIERLPQTDDVDVLLTAVSSLGIATGEHLEATGRLGRVTNTLLDVPATLEARGRDLAQFITAIESKDAGAVSAIVRQQRERALELRRELGAFLKFAESQDLETASREEMTPVLEILERVKNPVGKLLLLSMPLSGRDLAEAVARVDARRAEVLAKLDAR